MLGIDSLLLIGSVLILASIAIARLSDNAGLPALLLFLVVGMLAGSDGPGGIYFDDAGLSQSIGIVALILILFAGGLDTRWSVVRPVFWKAASLSTLGVILTASLVGVFVSWLLGFPPLMGLLVGAVVSSTDAAAVFSVLRTRNISLKNRLQPLLELESGSNDPMAIFLTIGIIRLLTLPQTFWLEIAFIFVRQMGIGAVCGYALGRVFVVILNRLNTVHEGLYPVFALAYAMFVYAVTGLAEGSGFLAVYVAAVTAGSFDFVRKKSLLRFFDGLAWLSQITMFVTLGLLVFPSQLVHIIGAGIAVSAFLMFIARPVSVFLSLIGSDYSWKEKTFVSWVGLRGAVPIILATFPVLAGVPHAERIFNIVFFIVLTSVLFQGWSIPAAARLLKLDEPAPPRNRFPLEIEPQAGLDAELVDLIVPYGSAVIGKPIVELNLPADCILVLLSRNEQFFVPNGSTTLQEGDTLLVLVNGRNLGAVRNVFAQRELES